jgi:hypothetical protein
MPGDVRRVLLRARDIDETMAPVGLTERRARSAPGLALAVTVVIGAASFCCLGYALTSLIRTEDAALPTTQALLLPLYFISGVFVAVTVLADVGEIFPVRHLANALLVAYNPHTKGLGFAGLDLLIVAAWGAAGLLIALRKFSWLGFRFVVYAIWRVFAQRRPFLCPECGAAVQEG